MNFSNWQQWSTRNKLGEILRYPSVYVVRFNPEKSEENTPFDWTEDIIYVGMTNSIAGLKGRLGQFDGTMRTSRVTHGGADRVRLKYQDYNHFVRSAYVSVCHIACEVTSDRPEDLRLMGKVVELEYLALAKYAERFGRLPEFNNKKGTKKFSKSTEQALAANRR